MSDWDSGITSAFRPALLRSMRPRAVRRSEIMSACIRIGCDRLRRMRVTNFEMEAAAIFTLCSLFGLRAGAACVVIADRFRNEFKPEGADQTLSHLGAETVSILAGMDATRTAAGKRWYFPSLGFTATS